MWSDISINDINAFYLLIITLIHFTIITFYWYKTIAVCRREEIMYSHIIDATANFRETNLQRRKLCKHTRSLSFYSKTRIARTNFLRDCFSTLQDCHKLSGRYWNFKLAIEYNGVRASSLCKPIMTATSYKSSAVSAFQLYIYALSVWRNLHGKNGFTEKSKILAKPEE